MGITAANSMHGTEIKYFFNSLLACKYSPVINAVTAATAKAITSGCISPKNSKTKIMEMPTTAVRSLAFNDFITDLPASLYSSKAPVALRVYINSLVKV